jgi:8-hydroxy-5-deazaflavin:NADPH oxidoreductase
MEIGIIGAGYIGGTLTRRLTNLGHTVRVANSRHPQTLSDLAAETGARAVWAGEAATDADLVIVSIPQKNVPDLSAGIVSTAKGGAPIIETNNYYPQQRDGYIAEIEDGAPESVWVSKQLGVPVFKVFNGIFWQHLLDGGLPPRAAGRIALPVAGDDPEAKQIVLTLVDDLGFDPVDGGSLAESWRQQPGTPVYGADLDAAGVQRALSEASPERRPEFRALR